MRLLTVLCIAALILGEIAPELYGQDWSNNWYFGFGGSAQRLVKSVNDSRVVVEATSDSIRYSINSAALGFGAQGFLGYRFSNRAGLTLTLGYSGLPFSLSQNNLGLLRTFSLKSNLLYSDLLFDVVLAKQGIFYPFVHAGFGGGVFSFGGGSSKRFTESHLIGGLGVRMLINSQMALEMSGAYNRTNNDVLDVIGSGGRDAYVNFRIGLSFFTRALNEQRPLEFSEQSKDVAFISLTKNSDGGRNSAISATSANSFTREYQRGREHFMAKRYRAALPIFSALADSYPSHPLAVNCLYWSGQCYYALGDYAAAITEHSKVLNLTSSLKKDGALFMIAKCHIQLKEFLEARQYLEQLVAEYPTSKAARSARNLLAKLPSR